VTDLFAVLIAAIGVIGVGAVIYATWWCVRAWSCIWGTPRSAYATMVYRHGARGWGLAMWIIGLVSLVIGSYQKHDDLRHASVPLLVEGMMFPVFLWFGHWWGRWMAFVFGIKDSHSAA